MNRNVWEGSELILYANGENVSIELSDMQVAAIARLLGLYFEDDGEYSVYSDGTLRQFMTMKGNPLRLQPIDSSVRVP